ncbi:hypothetical protein B0H11DRAFT_1933114 [Mycena galericulata]|nr:hypothetical protein B0H11DRAFT_1933114 [Mycena galericulata]
MGGYRGLGGATRIPECYTWLWGAMVKNKTKNVVGATWRRSDKLQLKEIASLTASLYDQISVRASADVKVGRKSEVCSCCQKWFVLIKATTSNNIGRFSCLLPSSLLPRIFLQIAANNWVILPCSGSSVNHALPEAAARSRRRCPFPPPPPTAAVRCPRRYPLPPPAQVARGRPPDRPVASLGPLRGARSPRVPLREAATKKTNIFQKKKGRIVTRTHDDRDRDETGIQPLDYRSRKRFTDPVTPGACQRVASLLVPGPFRPQVTIHGPSAQSTVQSHHFWRYQGFHLMDWHAQILTHTAVEVVAHEISETLPKSSPPIAWKLDCKPTKIALGCNIPLGGSGGIRHLSQYNLNSAPLLAPPPTYSSDVFMRQPLNSAYWVYVRHSIPKSLAARFTVPLVKTMFLMADVQRVMYDALHCTCRLSVRDDSPQVSGRTRVWRRSGTSEI